MAGAVAGKCSEALAATEDQCYKALLDSVAKTVYENIAADFDVPLSLWLMTGVPFFLFLFLAFFGRNVRPTILVPIWRSTWC